MSRLLHSLLKIDEREVTFSRRGFSCSSQAVRERLEDVGRAFLMGYHAALEQRDLHELAQRLDQVDADHRGFAYEGAAMALVLLDGLSPPVIRMKPKWRRFAGFLHGPGKQHIYMLHVGAGWAFARLPWLRRRMESVIAGFHPVLRWLAMDGYGFHEGYFHWRTPLQPKISRLSENARHVFYQGLGRSLWFVHGADARTIAQNISTFPAPFRADGWSGVGLGCAYAGGMNPTELEELNCCAGLDRAALAQGAAFAAGARQLAGNPAAHTDLACLILCGVSAEQAAVWCDLTLEQTPSADPMPYQKWRELLQKQVTGYWEQVTGREPAFDLVARHAAS